MEIPSYLSTREVAELLDINEKVVYSLIAEKGLPATKVTGKWIFPRALVELWLDQHVVNHPGTHGEGAWGARGNVFVVAGSNDILLEKTLSLFNKRFPELLGVFGNVGSMGGIRALANGLCHAAASHLLQDDETEYNFDYAFQEIHGVPPAVLNFCRREQGLIVQKGNPKGISSVKDLGKKGMQIANRPEGTGTRLLLDRELEKAGISGKAIAGYEKEFRSHLDVALEVFGDRADAAPAIRSAAGLLGLDFVPLRWERFDLLVPRERFFEETVQQFIGLLHESSFRELAGQLQGYDLSLTGKVVFPRKTSETGKEDVS